MATRKLSAHEKNARAAAARTAGETHKEAYQRLWGKKNRARNRKRQNPSVYDSAGKLFGKFEGKAAAIVARAIGGTVGKPRLGNPLPVGRYVTVKAKRLPNGRVLIHQVSKRKVKR
jgi:hypothetical protein